MTGQCEVVMGKASYHAKNGRFTSYDKANIVNKGGERFKMVRTLEPIKQDKGKEPEPPPEKSAQAEAILYAKTKVHSMDVEDYGGWVSIDEMCGLSHQEKARFGKGSSPSPKKKKSKAKDE